MPNFKLLRDIAAGGASNAESILRGAAASIPGSIGDIESIGRGALRAAFPSVSPTTVFPTSQELLQRFPQRVTDVRPESAGMEDMGMMMAPGIAKMTKGMPIGAATVWHGSPHKFSKFDASKIGTGEGAQAYGHGLYLAESPGVAKEYQKATPLTEWNRSGKSPEITLSNGQVLKPGSEEWNTLFGTWDSPVGETRARLASFGDKYKSSLDAIKDIPDNAVPAMGSLYKVDLPDEAIAKMLDWDKPMIDQPEAYLSLAKTNGLPFRGNTPKGGMDIYNSLVDELGGHDAAAKFLRDSGIPGIRYLDGGSRGTGAGTSNFVVFPGNEDLLTILERNGQPVTPSAGGFADGGLVDRLKAMIGIPPDSPELAAYKAQAEAERRAAKAAKDNPPPPPQQQGNALSNYLGMDAMKRREAQYGYAEGGQVGNVDPSATEPDMSDGGQVLPDPHPLLADGGEVDIDQLRKMYFPDKVESVDVSPNQVTKQNSQVKTTPNSQTVSKSATTVARLPLNVGLDAMQHYMMTRYGN